MSQIEVQTPELALAANGIGRLSADVQEALAAINSAMGQAGAFGDQPIAGTFLDMCAQGSRAAGEYGRVLGMLSQNVAMASLGYVRTDEGVIPVSVLGPEGRNP